MDIKGVADPFGFCFFFGELGSSLRLMEFRNLSLIRLNKEIGDMNRLWFG